jgi:hypothetical protein
VGDQVEALCRVGAVGVVRDVVVGARDSVLVAVDQVVEEHGEGAHRGEIGVVDRLGLRRGRLGIGRGGDQGVSGN